MVNKIRAGINELGMLNTYKAIIGTLVAVLLGIVAWTVNDIKVNGDRALEKVIIVDRNQQAFEEITGLKYITLEKKVDSNCVRIGYIEKKIK